MVLPLGRGSFALRRGACASSLTLLRTRQCLPRRCYSQSSDPEAKATADGAINETYKKDILGLWEKCMAPTYPPCAIANMRQTAMRICPSRTPDLANTPVC